MPLEVEIASAPAEGGDTLSTILPDQGGALALSDDTPAQLDAVSSPGVSGRAARSDHKHAISPATISAAGSMSATDKARIDSLIEFDVGLHTYAVDTSIGAVHTSHAFMRGAILQPASAKTVAITGVVLGAADQQLFDESFGGDVVLDGFSNSHVAVGWWGALPNDGEVASALVKATNNAGDNVTLEYVAGTYTLTGPATIGKATQTHRAERGTRFDVAGTVLFDGLIDWPDATVLTGTGTVQFVQPLPNGARAIWFGASVGAADNFAAFSRAYASSSTVQHTPGTYQCGAGTLGASAAVTTGFVRGAIIKPTGDLSIRGRVEAPGDQQIFDRTGGGTILLPDMDEVHPGWWGADATLADSGPAIRAAHKSISAQGGTVVLPDNPLTIDSSETRGGSVAGIIVKSSGMTFRGAGRRQSSIKMGATCSYIPILVQDFDPGLGDLEPNRITGFQALDFTIEYLGTGPASAGTIQMNKVSDFKINVDVIGDGAGMNNSTTDGIVLAYDCQDGEIDVLVDGISKGAGYISWATNVRATYIVRNSKSTVLPAAGGLQLSGARNCDITALISNVEGYGIDFVITAGIAATISALVNQTHFTIDFGVGLAYGPSIASLLAVLNTTILRAEELDVLSVSSPDSGRHYDIVLNTAPAQTLSVSQAIYGAYLPARDVTVRGASHDCRDEGVTMGSVLTGAFHERLVFDGYHCVNNGSYGFGLAVVRGVELVACVARGNTAGVFAADVGTNPDTEGLCANVRINGGKYVDNDTVGIAFTAVDGFSVSPETEVSTSNVATLQNVGVEVTGKAVAQPLSVTVTASSDLVHHVSHGYLAGQPVVFDTTANGITGGVLYYVIASGLGADDFKVSTTFGGGTINITSDGSNVVRRWKRCTDARIGKFAHPGYTTTHVYHPAGAGDGPFEGNYDFDIPTGTPEGGWYGPPGSEVASQSGEQYVKTSAGNLSTGWKKLYHTGDSDTAATASKLALRDGNADIFCRYAQVSTGVANAAGGIFYSVNVGSTHLFGDSGFNSYASISSTAIQSGADLVQWLEANTPSLTQMGRTTDVATHTMTIVAQAPYASATGTNRNSAQLNLKTFAPVAGGVAGSVLVSPGAIDTWEFGAGSFAAFGGAPATKQSITGAVSAILDANAKTVITSIIAFITAHSLATDSTS